MTPSGWDYDALGRPTQQRITGRVGSQTRQRSYQWVGADQLVSIDDSATGLSQYQYDPVGTLIGAVYSDGSRDVRQADVVGNLYRSADRQDRQYGPGGQLRQSVDGTRYRYDAEGNLTRKTLADGGQWHYGWDGAGQLVSVKRPDGYTVSFTYDAFGRRLSKHFRAVPRSGKTTYWVWDGNKPLHEWAELAVGSGADGVADIITWLFEENNFAPIAKLSEQLSYSVVTDYLGTPIEMYDQQGQRTWDAQLDSYGLRRGSVGKAGDCPFRYQGQYEDVETGLYYNRFRYYDPHEGVYISQDPLRLRGSEALYGYVKNPTTALDLFGLSPFYRGGRDGRVSFDPKPNEYRIDPKTGKVKETHGVSVFDNPDSVTSKGFEPYEIDPDSVSDRLDIKQRGNDPKHYEITPKEPMSLEDYKNDLSKIKAKACPK